jgi:glycerate kinase
MRVVVAPDSFKESLSASRVAFAIAEGVKRVDLNAELICIPMADGGEGTVEALVTATSGKIVSAPSVDALNRPIKSFYGVLGDGKTAVIEMAAASGLELLSQEEQNPLITSTYGTGLLLKAAMEAGFREIIIGIGGSATNDGGAGMAQALGFKLLDQNGQSIGFGGGSLANLFKIDRSEIHPLLSSAKITIACDVQNPLIGPSGATNVYAPQKGAGAEMLTVLESGMTHYSNVLKAEFGSDYSEVPGAGAAGGLGAGLMAFCNATMRSGFELIAELTDLERHISQADLVITGEGKIDAQTAYGKTISGIAKLCRKHRVTLIALAGVVSGDLSELYQQGLTSALAIASGPITADESKRNATVLLEKTSEQLIRLVLARNN